MSKIWKKDEIKVKILLKMAITLCFFLKWGVETL